MAGSPLDAVPSGEVLPGTGPKVPRNGVDIMSLLKTNGGNALNYPKRASDPDCFSNAEEIRHDIKDLVKVKV